MKAVYPPRSALILVAIMPQPADLGYARVLGWYRIPVKTAPRILNVDYLAFYQPASFLQNKWCVEYLAPVLGHELTTRIELVGEEPDHPRAHQEYFKVQLGPLRKLPHRIRAGGWKRFTFLYTTGDYLRKARTLTDLTVKASDRATLWKALRERAEGEQAYRAEELELDLSPDVLAAVLGIPQDISELKGRTESGWEPPADGGGRPEPN